MAITKVTTPELIDLPNNQLATVNTDGVVLPKGTTAQGAALTAVDGEFRYNTTTKKVEYYDGSSWFTLDSSTIVPQSGTTGTCDYPITATALYQFENNVNDTCGTYNGTANAITYTTGKFGQAAVFNGSSSFIDLNLKNQFKGTVSIWFNGGTPSAQCFLYASTAGSSGNKGIALLPQTNGTIRVLISQGTSGTNALDMSTTDTFFDSNWYNAVLTWDLSISGTNVYLYVNNVVKASGSATTGNWTTGQDSTSNLILGHYNNSGGSQTFNGNIDQVRIFSSVLTATQVGYLYTETAP